MRFSDLFFMLIQNGTVLRLCLFGLSLALGFIFRGIKLLRICFFVVSIFLLVYIIFRLNPNFIGEAQSFYGNLFSMFNIVK